MQTDTMTDRPESPSIEPVTLPPLRRVARRATPQVIDGVLLPLTLFLVADYLAGIGMAMAAGLGWSGFAIIRRIRRSRRVPAIVILGALMLSVRSALALMTGSAFLYFLQPTLGMAVVSLAFLLSVGARRPLSRHFAGDFITLPLGLLDCPHVHRFFIQNSMMWAVVAFFNAAAAYWLLVTLATTTFAITQAAFSLSVTVIAVGISILWFRRSIGRYHPITVGV